MVVIRWRWGGTSKEAGWGGEGRGGCYGCRFAVVRRHGVVVFKGKTSRLAILNIDRTTSMAVRNLFLKS